MEIIHGYKGLASLAVHGGRIADLSLLIQMGHTFLEEYPDDVPRQILHRLIFFGQDAVSAEDMESGMPPR